MDADGELLQRIRVPTPTDSYEETLGAVAALVADLGTARNIPVGIGTPGAISLLTGLMKNCNSTCLNGMPLREDLERKLGRSVRIANDADCFTLSEASDGAAAGSYSVFGVILGTGVGGGICVNQQPVTGVNAISGEWGHNPIALNAVQGGTPPAPGRRCYCQRSDCVEAWLSGPAFETIYAEQSGTSLPARDIVASAASGDETACQVLDQYHNLLALALSTVINILDPETIVLGGGMSNSESIYEVVPTYLPRYVFSDQINTKIVRAKHGDSSGVRGAAWLWPPVQP